ncbi:MAG TPA: hypothetical protein VN650_09000 [Gemmatimonadaceae bacterium]|nr:hypothetical protein [Gemmatimonadaceae bacterium]
MAVVKKELVPPQRRDRSKLIRFTASELEIVADRARGCGRPVACYIRDVALGGRPKTTTSTLNGEWIRELSRVAIQLCRLRDAAIARALPDAETFGAAVDEIIQLIRRID